MTTRNDNAQELDYDSFSTYGKTAIYAPLIIGCAIVAGVIIMWQTHHRNAQLVEMSRLELEARKELRNAYLEMRALRPEQALEMTSRAGKLIGSLNIKLAPDYAPLKISLLLVEAEALFMKDCATHAAMAEERFDRALALMDYASGGMWQFGMLGRARARIEQGKHDVALADLNAVLNRNPSFGAAYYWRALARERLDDLEGARADEQRARALDSWPPLRDYMQASCVWTRDILHKPQPCDIGAEAACPPTTGVLIQSIAPFFAPDEAVLDEIDRGE